MPVITTAYDALILVLTWVKTAGNRKSLSQLHIYTSLTTLLLRDGKCTSSVTLTANQLIYTLDRHGLLLVGDVSTRLISV